LEHQVLSPRWIECHYQQQGLPHPAHHSQLQALCISSSHRFCHVVSHFTVSAKLSEWSAPSSSMMHFVLQQPPGLTSSPAPSSQAAPHVRPPHTQERARRREGEAGEVLSQQRPSWGMQHPLLCPRQSCSCLHPQSTADPPRCRRLRGEARC